MGAFSKGQRVQGKYRGQAYQGVITNVTARESDTVVSVKLDSVIQVENERGSRDKFMTSVDDFGDFTSSVTFGYMRIMSEPAQPPDVDMGGDFEGFVGAVNQPQAEQAQVWYTTPVTSADGEKITARVTATDDGYMVEILANGLVIPSETETFYFRGLAIDAAQSKAIAYMVELNRQRAAEMGDETETPASNYPDHTERINRKHERMEEIRRALARLDRERESLAFELSQLQEE